MVLQLLKDTHSASNKITALVFLIIRQVYPMIATTMQIRYNVSKPIKGTEYMGIAFRHTAGFGKRMEYKIVGDMLMEGLNCYLPLVDDHGVDCVIKKQDGIFIEIQIKARSREVTFGDAALFSAIEHSETPNFYLSFILSA